MQCDNIMAMDIVSLDIVSLFDRPGANWHLVSSNPTLDKKKKKRLAEFKEIRSSDEQTVLLTRNILCSKSETNYATTSTTSSFLMQELSRHHFNRPSRIYFDNMASK